MPTFQVAICRKHRNVVTAKSIIAYADSYHRYLAAHVRRRIAEEASALRDSGSLAANTSGIRFPSDIVPAIDGLPMWSNGKKCI